MDDDDDDEGTVHFVHTMQPGGYSRRRIPKCTILLSGHQVPSLINTRASINILAQSVLETIPIQPLLRPTTTQVYAFGSSKPVSLAGVFTTDISHEEQSTHTKVYVTPTGSGMLLSCRMAEQLNLISFAFSAHLGGVNDILAEFAQLFEGFGCLRDRLIHLHINNSIQPVALKDRRAAFHLRLKVEPELRKLEQADIIYKWRAPTPGFPLLS
ncbi:hypothetical protein NDU88_001114 [Pleurodeles waltl]|uniref:Uncharacterized protein n=1 Tax=Pleurodeles waltl TaxID=8319 RepID=A0AAV7SBQ3_PLEWA|nr:hypothetical protein NDU88_001114 [Pleurodeles waltl]